MRTSACWVSEAKGEGEGEAKAKPKEFAWEALGKAEGLALQAAEDHRAVKEKDLALQVGREVKSLGIKGQGFRCGHFQKKVANAKTNGVCLLGNDPRTDHIAGNLPTSAQTYTPNPPQIIKIVGRFSSQFQ